MVRVAPGEGPLVPGAANGGVWSVSLFGKMARHVLACKGLAMLVMACMLAEDSHHGMIQNPGRLDHCCCKCTNRNRRQRNRGFWGYPATVRQLYWTSCGDFRGVET